jgi:hypothetical protein
VLQSRDRAGSDSASYDPIAGRGESESLSGSGVNKVSGIGNMGKKGRSVREVIKETWYYLNSA